MKKLALLSLLICSGAQAIEHGVIYGEDNRIELIKATLKQQSLARSTAIMVPKANIKHTKVNRKFWFDTSKAEFEDLMTFGQKVEDVDGIALCEEERFKDQLSPGNCSGFLVADDILVTAGHCIMNDVQCKENEWVFDYKIDDEGKYSLKSSDVYSCQKVLAWQNDFISGFDYSIIKLTKKVKGRSPLKFRESGKIEDNTGLMVIGYPYGVSAKVATGASVKYNVDENYFMADLDTLAGNSGSAVFNEKTGLVEGILVRGEDDFEYDEDRECFKSKRCEKFEDCRGEDVVRISQIPELQKGTKISVIK